MLTIKHTRAALLSLLVFIASASHADIAVHNVKGYTSTNNGLHEFSVLLINEEGRVIATGDKALLLSYPDAMRVDGGGRTLLPGLTDAHGHVAALGALKTRVNLVGSNSLAEARHRIHSFATEHESHRWILGSGWNQVLWTPKAFPTSSDIDSVVSDRPVWLARIDGHAGWANSAAMQIAGIDDETEDPIGGKIVRDANGKATGILIDKAMDLVSTHVPRTNKADVRQSILLAAESLIAEGITSTHDAGIDVMNVEVYLSMADNQELPLRIVAMLAGAGEVLDAIDEPIRAYGNDHLDIAAVKIYTDGALGSRGAAMIAPYDDDAENRGLPFWSQQELDQQVRKANAKGFPIAIHAIGDLGNKMALDAIEQAQNDAPAELRNRIEHAQVIHLDDLPRFAELGVIASMQAVHATSDKNMAEDRIGPNRIRGAYAWRRLLESGAVLANGSDYPVEYSNPFHGLYAAVTRRSRDGEPDGGWYIDQALTRTEALHSFTLAAAYAANQDDRLGSLEAGKWADFIIIDRNYFDIPESEIDDIRVLQTWVAGKQIYKAGEAK